MSPDTSEIENALNRLRPAMQVDGGDVDLVSVEAGVVSVRLSGTCIHCPSAGLTLKAGIEQRLKADFPWIMEVKRVT